MCIRDRTNIEGQFAERDIPTFDTQLNERDAFRAMFSFGQSLSELDDKDVPNIIKAKTNARAFAAEVLEELRRAGRNSKPEPTE